MNRATWQKQLSESGLTPATIAIGYRLAEYGDSTGADIFPSLVGLAKRLGYRNPESSGRRCVQRLLRRLVEAGWLLIDRGVGRKGRGGRTNRYRLCSPYADLSGVDCVMCALEGVESCGCPAAVNLPEGAVEQPPNPLEEDPELGDLGPAGDDELTDAEDASMAAHQLIYAVGADIGDEALRRKVAKRFELVPRDVRLDVWRKCLGPLPDTCDNVAGLLLNRIKKHDRKHWHRRVSVWVRAGVAFAKVR